MKFSNLFCLVLLGVTACASTHSQRNPAEAAPASHAFAGQPSQFGDIVRNADGSILALNQQEAFDYCACNSDSARNSLGCKSAPLSMHLPSARELTQLSATPNPQELSQFSNESAANDAGYYLVEAKNAGKVDRFYLNSQLNSLSPGNSNYSWLWSSSVVSHHSDRAWVLGSTGDVISYVDNRNLYLSAFRCVTGP